MTASTKQSGYRNMVTVCRQGLRKQFTFITRLTVPKLRSTPLNKKAAGVPGHTAKN